MARPRRLLYRIVKEPLFQTVRRGQRFLIPASPADGRNLFPDFPVQELAVQPRPPALRRAELNVLSDIVVSPFPFATLSDLYPLASVECVRHVGERALWESDSRGLFQLSFPLHQSDSSGKTYRPAAFDSAILNHCLGLHSGVHSS